MYYLPSPRVLELTLFKSFGEVHHMKIVCLLAFLCLRGHSRGLIGRGKSTNSFPGCFLSLPRQGQQAGWKDPAGRMQMRVPHPQVPGISEPASSSTSDPSSAATETKLLSRIGKQKPWLTTDHKMPW